MISKGNVLNYLLNNRENEINVDKYIYMLQNMSEAEWEIFAISHNIETLSDVQNQIDKRENESEQKFTNLNELVSFGRDDNTIHIHLVPTDARFLLNREGLKTAELSLIDALEKIQNMLIQDESYKDINNIYAVSGLIKRPIHRIFQRLGFDVKTMKIQEAKNDEELGNFYERFKDKKDLGRAKMSKEKLISKEWNDLKNEIKASHINGDLDKRKNEFFLNSIEVTKGSTRACQIESQDSIINNNLDLNINKNVKE